MDMEEVEAVAGNLTFTATETPAFIIPSTSSNARQAVVDSAIIANTVAVTNENITTLHNSVQVYPNPTVSYITVDMKNKTNAPIEINLFDAGIGRLHKQLRIEKGNSSEMKKIDISTLPTGVYILEIKQGNDRAFRKIVKGL